MKKIMSLLLAAAMMLAVFAGCGSSEGSAAPAASAPEAAASGEAAGSEAQAASTEKIALVTDVGNIDDESFNQTCYEAMVAFGKDKGIETTYYKPTEDSTDARVMSITQAVNEGATVVVMPGFLFGEAIGLTQDQFPDVKFIAVDVGEGDLGDTKLASNTHSMIFHEEQAGYLAGYAAVKDGYTKLGFLGGMAVPAVQRYGYGYIQGINAAAEEMGVDVEINYTYGGQFFCYANITSKMERWHSEGTEVVFACGGGIYTSAVEAANKHEGKVIGVDVDQASIDPCIITSAMKGLYAATYSALETYVDGKWDTIGGTLSNLSLTEGDYVGLPTKTESWRLNTFTVEEYEKLVAGIKDGSVAVSDSIEAVPEVGSHVKLNVIE